MKRREEITQTAKNKYSYIKGLPQSASHREVFIEAVEWADKTMIEKAYKWILCNMPKYVKANQLDVFINNEDMANDFKQAMEE